MAACLLTYHQDPPTAFAAMLMGMYGVRQAGDRTALTACTCLRPTASASERSICRKFVPTFVSAASRGTASSWPPASLSTLSTSTPKERTYSELHYCANRHSHSKRCPGVVGEMAVLGQLTTDSELPTTAGY